MRKMILKHEGFSKNEVNGGQGTARPTRAFSLNAELFPERKHLSHWIPNWIQLEEELYFITLTCKVRGHNSLCFPETVQRIFSALEFYASQKKMFPYTVLLMPDHIHGIFGFSQSSGIRKPLNDLKHYLSRHYYLELQEGFFEHRIRNEEYLRQIEDYILNNPVRKGLVSFPEHWKYIYRHNCATEC